MTTKIVVLGDGAWGIAVATLLARRAEHQVILWSAREETGLALQSTRENARLLPGFRVPESVALTLDIEEAVYEAALLVTAIPTVYLRNTIERFRPYRRPDWCLLSLTKGTELETFLRPSEILQDILGTDRIAVLSGPSHAEEVVRGSPTSVVIAGSDGAFVQQLQERFSNERFRVYTNNDIIGVELAGALKNVIAIAAGISDGLGFGDNAKAALLTRGLDEMTRFGVALGASPETYRGLAGMGDLITTSYSPHGRNRALGYRLGLGETPEQILAGTPKICEGATTARSVYERARQMGIEMPITQQVHDVLYEGRSPRDAVGELMSRRSKRESRI